MNAIVPTSSIPNPPVQFFPMTNDGFSLLSLLKGKSDSASGEAIARTIDGFRDLEDDYDGAGSLAPSPDAISAAKDWWNYLERKNVAAPVAVVPGVNGVITFEWDNGRESTILEIVSAFRAEGYLCRRGESRAEPFELLR